MIHTEKMTQGHNGMRKGISLVEMLVAIVLFGIIGTIGYTYYKNYYNTSFAGKQVRIYTLVEQASNAYDLYLAKHGNVPTDINAMVQDKILTEIPAAMPGLTTVGWKLEDNISTSTSSDNNDTSAFTYIMDANLTNQTKLDYCNILNNVAWSDWELNNTDDEINGSSDFYAHGTAGAGELEYFHCADSNDTIDAGLSAADHNFTFFFLK